MLKRRAFLTGVTAALIAGSPAMAQDYAAEIEAQLRRRGYRIESVGRTLLGRVRILAENDDGAREIIVNPRTGEILRDLWTAKGKGPGGTRLRSEDADVEDEDEDEDKDDDKDKGKGSDNSGHGSSGDNSGSGGGGSGNSGGGDDD